MSEKINWLQRVAKWRAVLCSWQLGTRSASDPEAQAVRDHRELSLLLRVELSALTAVLVDKGIFTAEEYLEAVEKEAEQLNRDYEMRFPGFKATDVGMDINPTIARDTTAGWRP